MFAVPSTGLCSFKWTVVYFNGLPLSREASVSILNVFVT